MEIIIVGAGIAGLTAAIALRRSGHKIRIFERTPTAAEFGAAVSLGSSSAKVLQSYGLDFERWNINLSTAMKAVNGATLEIMFTIYRPNLEYFAHRVDLQQGLLDLATRADYIGDAVNITYDAPVSSYDPAAGTITLEDSTIHYADLVIAADGLHSNAPSYILSSPPPLRNTSTTNTRFMLPISAIKHNTTLSSILPPNQFTFLAHQSLKRYLITCPVRNNTLQNFGMYTHKHENEHKDEHKDEPKLQSKSADTSEDQFQTRYTCDRASLRRQLDGFHESIQQLAAHTEDTLSMWKLQDRDPLSTWLKRRLLLIGDAAHPMLTSQGSGAAMCIEDACALGEILKDVSIYNEKLIAERLDIFQRLRWPRTTIIQLLSRALFYEDPVETMMDTILEYVREEDLPDLKGAGKGGHRLWIDGYDILEEARRAVGGLATGML